MRRRDALGLWLAASACVPVPSGQDPLVVDVGALPPPTVDEVTLACARDAGVWSLSVKTSAWSGGGGMIWTVDGAYVERHDGLRSTSAAANGLGDTLVLDVPIVVDFRGASNGRTAFRCVAEPAAAVFVADLEGTVTDCVRLSADPVLDGVEALEGCTRLATGVSAEDTDDTDDTDA